MHLGSIPSRVKPKTMCEFWYSQLPCLTFYIKTDSVNPSPLVVENKSASRSCISLVEIKLEQIIEKRAIFV